MRLVRIVEALYYVNEHFHFINTFILSLLIQISYNKNFTELIPTELIPTELLSAKIILTV